jgi:hypothetical protein
MLNPTHAKLVDDIRSMVVSRNPEQAWVLDNAAFLHVGGSTLYGTNTPGSDLDVRGVTIAPKSYWVGARIFEQLECAIPERNVEVVIYDVRKWLRLAVAVNPNVVETLFVDDDSPCTVLTTGRWKHIRGEMLALLNQRGIVHKPTRPGDRGLPQSTARPLPVRLRLRISRYPTSLPASPATPRNRR